MTSPDLEHSSTPDRPKKRGGPWGILLVFLALILSGGWYTSYVLTPGPESPNETAIVSIPRGTSVRGISEILAREGIINPDVRFLLLAKLSGYSSRLQAGEFRLRTGIKPLEVLRELASARSIEYPITIPEGLRAAEIAQIFGDYGWCNPKSFLNLVNDKAFLAKLGFPHLDSLEGYLYPDTYLFTRDITGAEKIIPIMVKRFNEVWSEVTAGVPGPVDLEKTVILASIVEKETGTPQERPLIAAVFQNRLQSGMRLQSDPTVIYGTKKFSAPISKSDLLTDTPYNTYTLPGLPVGPICSPGKDALLAVLHPTPTDTLYFVSKNDGTHHFSKSLIEHNRAVEKYQRKNSDKKGK